MIDIKNDIVISTVTAFVSVDKDGNEGVIGMMSSMGWVPFVCADEKRIASLYPHAKELSKASGIPFKVLQFSTRTDITNEIKEKFD